MGLMRAQQIKILIVDDEESIVEFIKMGLEEEGFEVFTAYSGDEAVELAKELNPHVIILDIMLPGINGFEACNKIKKSIKTSIIMLTAREEIEDRVKGLEIGADDYMVKPFSFKELLARINARIRNTFPELSEKIYIDKFIIDEGAHEIFFDDSRLKLSVTEYNLLKFLLLNNGLVLSKTLILEKVWDFDFNGADNIVEVYVKYLRDKIGDKDHNIIQTVRGIGYKVVLQ